MPKFPGTLADYLITAASAGGVLLQSSKYGTSSANAGEEVHFNADDRDYLVENGKLVALDGPVSNQSSEVRNMVAPCPECAKIKARWPGLLDRLAG